MHILGVFFCHYLCITLAVSQRNLPIPLNYTETSTFLGQHNVLRAALKAGNMECMIGYSDTLAAHAVQAAMNCTCNMQSSYRYGTAYYFSGVPGPLPSPEAIVQGFYDEGANFYDYESNTCEMGQTCANFKQFAWYEGKEVGCAIVKCESVVGPCAGYNSGSPGFLAACSYTYKALQNQIPYTADRLGRPCTSCSSEARFCSQGLCCPIDLMSGGGGRGGYCGGQPGPEELVYLSRMFNNLIRSNLLVTGALEVRRLMMYQKMQFIGNIGAVALRQDTQVCPFLVPIHHLWDRYRRLDYFTVNLEGVQSQGNWEQKGIIGYTVPGPHLCGADVAIYEFFSSVFECVIQLQNGTDVRRLFKNEYVGDYKFVSISFYVWNASVIYSQI